jgi:hypothetical protein
MTLPARQDHPRGAPGPARLLVALLGAYKRWISPLLPRACRFSPTCSEYARLALLKYGFWRGSALGSSTPPRRNRSPVTGAQSAATFTDKDLPSRG